MKHKSWIKNYERNFEKLAEEIGDLRYDTLAEFLKLLGNKIERDGIKDKERGRLKLAKQLQGAANQLIDASVHIQKAWLICEPYMFPKDITDKIKTEFTSKEAATKAFKILSDYYRGWDTDINFRLARCLLFETNGDIEKLETNICIANDDPRDIMIQAEYDTELNRLRNFNRAFGEEKITEKNLENDRDWASDVGDDLPF